VVARDVSGNVDLYLVDAETGEFGQQLTTAGEADVAPLVAPDRKTVVYIRSTDAGDVLRTVAADGSGDRLLFEETPSACADPARPAWSTADPTQLVIACHDDPARTTLRLIGLDGATLHELDPGQPYADDVTLSPDGREVAFWAGGPDAVAGNLFVVPVDGSAPPRQLTDTGADNDPVWSPDGSLIAFSRVVGPGNREIHVVAPDGSGVRSLATGGPVDQGPGWSPDGARVSFKSNRPTDAEGDTLWDIDPAGQGLRQIGTDGGVLSTPAWATR
jgi:Tol biopolymer transport system component